MGFTDVLLWVSYITDNFLIYVLSFVVVLSLLVFVHEWGHYIVARMCGVKVDAFSIGFGKELFGRYDRHGTRWKVCLVPLGGYVKLFGDVDPASAKKDDTIEDEETGERRHLSPQEREQAFFAKPVWQRALVVFAGPAINYIFAIILLFFLFLFLGQPATLPVVSAVIKDSAADQAGFMPGDKILSIDGHEISEFKDLSREMMIGLDADKVFVLDRNGEAITVDVTPERESFEDRFGFKHTKGLLGVYGPGMRVDIDDIASVNGQTFEEVQPEAIVDAIMPLLGSPFDVVFKGGDEEKIVTINPVPSDNEEFSTKGSDDYGTLRMYVEEAQIVREHGVVSALYESVSEAWEITAGTVRALWQIVTGTRSAKELGGVIRIGAVAGDMAKQGVIAVVFFTALLSINLGFINMLPIPLLDGGHLLFYAIESIIRRPIPEKIQDYAFQTGFAFLIFVMVFANFNDIMQIVLRG